MNDQFSFNPFKKRPDFYLPNSQPQRQQARRIWEALCALSAPSANTLTVYMETVLRDLIPLSEALLTLFPLREGESADLTDPADPERYWFHGGTQRNPDKPRQVFQLELAWDDRVRMYPEDHAAVQLRSFAPDSPVICHLSRVRREWGLVQVFYDRILPAEDADQVMPDSAFLDAIYTLGKDGAAGLTQRQRQRLASDQVRLRGVRLEYAAFLQLRVLSADTLGRAPRGLADYDLLLSLAGERLPFTEDGDTDVSSLRFPELLGRAEAIVTALTEICSPPVALHYYMNSLLKACVSLEALCSKLAFSAPEEELRHFFTRYPLRLAEEGGVLRSKNILCRSFRFTEGGGPGLYTLTGYDPRSGAVLLSPVSQSGSST